MVIMSSEDEDREWIFKKFKSIVNPFLRKHWDAHDVSHFWWGLSLRTTAMDKPSAVVATTTNLIEPDGDPSELGNVMNNLMFDFITKSSVKEMEMDDATELLRNNVNTNIGIIGQFGTRFGMRAWYITCGNWILCNAEITAPKAKSRVSKPMEWKDVFDGGGSEGDIKIYYFTDGAALFAPPKKRKLSMSAGVKGRKGGVTFIQKSRIIPKLLLYTTTPLLNWKDLPTQFLFND